MDRWKAEIGRVREKRRVEETRSEKRGSQKKEDADGQKVGKSGNTVFFQWFVAPEDRKVGSLKRRVRGHLARWEMKKMHAVVAQSTSPRQNVQNTPFSDHFWKLRCRKSARRCGTKYISKWKCTKHTRPGPLLEVEMSKKCTPLLREAHSVAGAVQEACSMDCKNRRTNWHEAVSSALNFPFLKDVWQNCFIFDVHKFKTWRGLAELLRFGRCQVQKKKSRRIVSYLTVSSSNIEEVS